MWLTWREAMQAALYGPGGFYARGERPGWHFRTSAHASGRYAVAVLTLLRAADLALGQQGRLDLVDVGAGGGELAAQALSAADGDQALAGRVAVHAVDVAARPAGLDPRIGWGASIPRQVTGLVMASEWLDNLPLDVAELGPDGPRLVLVDPATGAERLGPRPCPADLDWLRRWWPLRRPGERAEIGRPRDLAWAEVIGRLAGGLAIAADYGHLRDGRPPGGTLAGYLAGRPVPPLPDGSRDVTAHVALDACAAAGQAAGAAGTLLTTQCEALRALGLASRPPAAALARSDPLGYLAGLQRSGEEAELTDPAGLGGFGWLVQCAGMALPAALAGCPGMGA
jgi:SAM-dependent MidA family methyltransferase